MSSSCKGASVVKVDRLAAINRSTGRPILTPEQRRIELGKVRRYNTLAAREQRRADKLKWHARAMEELWRALGWGEYPDRQQGRLI